MEIVVIGMGYVGIPTAALFAEVDGFNVTGVQRSSKRSGWKIDYLNSGKCPFKGNEPGLNELIEKVVKKGTFRVIDNVSICQDANVIFIDVQTPIGVDHKPTYDSLKEVCGAVGKYMRKGVMIILESTVAPGTTINIVKPILEEASLIKAGKDFNLVFSYERVMTGRLLYNMKNLPRIVGGFTNKCTQKGIKLYKKIVKAEIYPTDILTAETSKVVENTYRDVNIAFANEVGLICESLGVNVHNVRRFVNSMPNDSSDPMKNPYRMMLTPGAGVGGHCLPKDPWLLKYGLDAFGSKKYNPQIIIESRRINDYMPEHMKNLTLEVLEENKIKIKAAKISILGFTFLEDSDDIRNTPALPLYNLLKNECKEIVIHDPYIKDFQEINITRKLKSALKESNCIIVVTRHKEYLNLSLDKLKMTLKTSAIVDGRNVFNPEECIKAGFSYRGVGIGRKEMIRNG